MKLLKALFRWFRKKPIDPYIDRYKEQVRMCMEISKHYTSIYQWTDEGVLDLSSYKVITKILEPLELVAVMGLMSDRGIYHGVILDDLKIVCRYFRENHVTFKEGIQKIIEMDDEARLKAFGIRSVARVVILSENYDDRHAIMQNILLHED